MRITKDLFKGNKNFAQGDVDFKIEAFFLHFAYIFDTLRLSKPLFKGLILLIDGLIKAKTPILSKIVDSLKGNFRVKENIDDKKNDKKYIKIIRQYFSRLINRHDFSKIHDAFFNDKLKNLQDTDVIYLDDSDISKSEAEKMEGLKKVRNGDKKNNNGSPFINNGYNTTGIISYNPNGDKIPSLLYYKIVPQSNCNDSENKNTIDLIKKVYFKSNGDIRKNIFCGDRGYDRSIIINFLMKSDINFLIRLNKRTLKGEKESFVFNSNFDFGDISSFCQNNLKKTKKNFTKDKYNNRNTVISKSEFEIYYGKIKIKVGEEFKDISILISKNIKDNSVIVLYTNMLILNDKMAHDFFLIYFRRWKIEDTFKCLKSRLGMEKIQLTFLQAINNMLVCIYLVHTIMESYLLRQDIDQEMKKLFYHHREYNFPKKGDYNFFSFFLDVFGEYTPRSDFQDIANEYGETKNDDNIQSDIPKNQEDFNCENKEHKEDTDSTDYSRNKSKKSNIYVRMKDLASILFYRIFRKYLNMT